MEDWGNLVEVSELLARSVWAGSDCFSIRFQANSQEP